MRSPKDFFKPLAVGAPAPLREIPIRPSRMIHFFPASNPKLRAKLPDMVGTVDVLLANLEDGVPASDKPGAAPGWSRWPRAVEFGDDPVLDSRQQPRLAVGRSTTCTAAVLEAGDALDVIMIPKVEGPEDIHYVDRLLAQLEAKAGLREPLLVHAILETARGVANVEEICLASPRMQGLSLGPADLAANRRMKTTRVGGGHPDYVVRADPRRRRRRTARADVPAGPLALHDRPHGRRLRDGRDPSLLRAVRRHRRHGRLRGPVPQRLPARLRRRLVAAPEPDRDRQAGVHAAPERRRPRPARDRGDGRRHGRDHARRQDGGRRLVSSSARWSWPSPASWPPGDPELAAAYGF